MTHFCTQKPQWVCRCGHSESAHDAGAGACWHPSDNDQDLAVRCTCDGYEEVADDDE